MGSTGKEICQAGSENLSSPSPPENGYRLTHRDEHVIQRSRFGILTIRFDGGCSYPSMIEFLKLLSRRFGHLIVLREKLSGQGWADRIVESGHSLSGEEVEAILTLMWKKPK